MPPRLLVLGWDSATFDVADPLMAAGKLPILRDVLERGFRAPLRSTWPPMTDCAWTSAFTGRNPGAHGIFGSWYRAPGEYACRYFSSRDRSAPALWEMTDEARLLIWNVPMTFPATTVKGAMVAGYGAPPGSKFCDPPALQESLVERWPLEDLLDRAPHRSLDQFFVDLLRGLEVQADAIEYTAKKTGADCLVAVWPHVDRAQHFFWRFRGSDHRLASAVDAVYEAMDRATGRLLEAFPEADVMIVSDHGAGRLEGDVNAGAWLARRGDAVYGRARSSARLRVAWAMPPRIRKLAKRIAPGAARRTVGATLTGQLGPFDWSRTRAFVGFHGDLWVNLVGREPQGIVEPADADAFLDELAAELLTLQDPRTATPVFAAAHRRSEIYSGTAEGFAPDLMLDSWTQGYRIAPNRGPTEDLVIAPVPLAGVDSPWSADHRPLGIFAAAGPHIAAGAGDELSLYDVCPTALALLEQPVPEGLDGRVPPEVIDAGWLESHPIASRPALGERDPAGPSDEPGYSEREAAAVAAHLKDLGYIE